MSGLDTLKTRLNYYGGTPQNRLINDKALSLKSAIRLSYQSQIIELKDGRQFRCLINPNKETGDYDNKILSIPYDADCLNSIPPHVDEYFPEIKPTELVGIQPGDVFRWVSTDTHWIVFLQYLQENAYFRAQIRKCDQQIDVNGQKYWVYLRGPVQTKIVWAQKGGVEWNDLNYTLNMYITRDENTVQNIKRFTKIKIAEPVTGQLKTWQVQAVNRFYGDGIIQVHLKETFQDMFEQTFRQSEGQDQPLPPPATAYIDGPKQVQAYSVATYSIKNSSGGTWYVNTSSGKVNYGNDSSIQLDINMRKGSFVITYQNAGVLAASLTVNVKSF